MTTNPDLDQAREWAESVGKIEDLMPATSAAVEVIQSLPDEWIDADKLRDVINGQLSGYPHGTARHHMAEEIACKLQALFHTPQPRTLADMTAAEQEACRWMQAKIFHSASTVACVVDPGDFRSTILFQDGAASNVDNDQITPLPDFSRMVWPASEPVAEDAPELAPAKLVTMEDYHNAPNGTVVWGDARSSDGSTAVEKYVDYWHETGIGDSYDESEMADLGPHEVLRWGDVS